MSNMRLPESKWFKGWNVTTLGTICNIQLGKTPPTKDPKYWNGNLTWITISDMDSHVVYQSQRTITERAIEEGKAVLISKGTLLMSFKLTIGKLAFAGKDLCTNEAIAALVIKEEYKDKVRPEYLYWVLQAIPLEQEAILAVKGKTINKSTMRSIRMPIPEVPEQERIVARIEALFVELAEMRALHEKIVGDTGQLMDAVIQEVFDRPNNDWQTSLLAEDNIAFIQTGTAKGRRFGNRETMELPYLRVANVQAGYLDLSEIKIIEIAADEVERYRLQPGDLLLTEGGDYDKLGRGAIWEGQIDPCIHQNHIFAVRFNQDVIWPKFAEYEMRSWYAKSYFLRVAKKTTNLATINKTKLGNFPIRYPPLREQKALVEYFDAVNIEIAEMHKTQDEDASLLGHLEQSILAQAFRGEL